MDRLQRYISFDSLAIISLVAIYFLLERYLAQQGMFFITTPLHHFFQVLDIRWLEEDLFNSLLYLHSQPPLFNFMIGLGVISFGNNIGEVFGFIYQIIALAIILLLYINLSMLGI